MTYCKSTYNEFVRSASHSISALCQNLQSDFAYAQLDLSEIKRVVQESLEVQQGEDDALPFNRKRRH